MYKFGGVPLRKSCQAAHATDNVSLQAVTPSSSSQTQHLIESQSVTETVKLKNSIITHRTLPNICTLRGAIITLPARNMLIEGHYTEWILQHVTQWSAIPQSNLWSTHCLKSFLPCPMSAQLYIRYISLKSTHNFLLILLTLHTHRQTNQPRHITFCLPIYGILWWCANTYGNCYYVS